METETTCQDSSGKSANPATERDTTTLAGNANSATVVDTSAHRSQSKQPKSAKPADAATETGTCPQGPGTTPSKLEEKKQFSPHAPSAEGPGVTNDAETNPNPFAAVTWPESYPYPTQLMDNDQPAVTTLPDATPPENAVSGATEQNWEGHSLAQSYQAAVSGAKLDDTGIPAATKALNEFAKSWSPELEKLDAKIDQEGPWGPFANDETRQKLEANGKRLAAQILRNEPATGTEAQVCADIAERQRSKGLPKYKITVAENPLPLVDWLTHAYEEVLDLAIYLKRTIHEIENETQNHGGSGGVLPAVSAARVRQQMAGPQADASLRAGVPARTRKPGSGRKAIPCPKCGTEKSIGMTTLNKIPTRRCKACGHVIKQYPNLAKQTTA